MSNRSGDDWLSEDERLEVEDELRRQRRNPQRVYEDLRRPMELDDTTDVVEKRDVPEG